MCAQVALAGVLRQRRLRELEEDLGRRAVVELQEQRRYEEAVQAQEVRACGGPTRCAQPQLKPYCVVTSPRDMCVAC